MHTFLWFTTQWPLLPMLVTLALLGFAFALFYKFRSLVLLISAVVLGSLINWRSEVPLVWVQLLLSVIFVLALLVGWLGQAVAFVRPSQGAIKVAEWGGRIANLVIVFALVVGLVRWMGVRSLDWMSEWKLWQPFGTFLFVLACVGLVVALVFLRGDRSRAAVVGGVSALAILVLVFGSGLVNWPWSNPTDNVASIKQAKAADPIAVLSYEANDGLTVSFDGSQSTAPDDHELLYDWEFGDGTHGSDKTMTHPYTKAGTYKVYLTVTDKKTAKSDPAPVAYVEVKSSTMVKTGGVVVNNDSACKGVYVCGGKDGFKAGQLQMGTGKIPNSPREAATISFSGKTIKSRQMLDAAFHSDDPMARKAINHAKQSMTEAGYTAAQTSSCFNSADHWVWVSPTVASQVSGTTYPVNGKVVTVRGFRGVAANDATWFCVDPQGDIIPESAIRADCMNAEPKARITPIPEGHNPPSIAIPPGQGGPPPGGHKCPPGTHPSPQQPDTCVAPKDPKQNVLRNPEVPDQVKGRGTTPVGTSPGAPSTTHDGGTGCGGPCKGSTSGGSGSGSGSTGSGGSGGGPSLPAPTEPPAPKPKDQPVQTTDPDEPPPSD